MDDTRKLERKDKAAERQLNPDDVLRRMLSTPPPKPAKKENKKPA